MSGVKRVDFFLSLKDEAAKVTWESYIDAWEHSQSEGNFNWPLQNLPLYRTQLAVLHVPGIHLSDWV